MISSKPSPDKLIVNDVMNISDVCDVQKQVTYFALLPLSKTELRKNILNFTEMFTLWYHISKYKNHGIHS